jgi:hypothetical protein
MRHLIIPDVQVKPNQDISFLTSVGKYIVDMKPDVIVCIGDFFDMPSLSVYDIGKKSFEGRCLNDDLEAGKKAMETLLQPIRNEQMRLIRNKDKQWKPRMVFTLGNHEERIMRAIESDRKLEGFLSYDDLGLEEQGWDVKDFLEVVVIDGVAYSHYMVSGSMGRPIGTAQQMVNKTHMSCVVGHQQGRQVAYGRKADGSSITCIIAGSCYDHNEDYMGSQGNKHWRGVVVLNEVDNGSFDEMFVSLKYLKGKYA